jgi:hypothetical protein
MLQAGGGILGQLLAADAGYRGPRVPCGQGHEAEFISYPGKVTGTVAGPVTLTRTPTVLAGQRHAAILEMIVREPSGEPKVMMILSMAGLCEASRSTGTPHSCAS